MIKFYSIKETEFGIYLTVIFARCVVGLILHYTFNSPLSPWTPVLDIWYICKQDHMIIT